MLLGEEGNAVIEPAGDFSGAGGAEAEVPDSVTHWRECNAINGFKF